MFKVLVCALTYQADKSDVSVYIENVVRELSADHLVYVMIHKKDRASFPAQNENVFFVPYSDMLSSSLIGRFWHLFILPFCINYKKFDFMILPEVGRRLFCRYPIFTISVMHQIISKERIRKFGFIKRFYLNKLVPKYMKKANRVVCTSKTIYDQMQDRFDIDPSKMCVNYPGYDRHSFNDRIIVDKGALKAEYGLRNNFILYAADIEYPRNNHINLIKAYDRLPEGVKQQFDLVFIGVSSVGADVVLQYAKHSDYSNHIKFLSRIPEKYFPALYKMATVYVQPSVEDVYGTRLVEAMACGTPVICSDNPSLVEIGGDAVHSCSATDFEAISMHLDAVLGFESEQQDMATKGLKVVEQFSWSKHSLEIVDRFTENNRSEWSERFREMRNSNESELSHPERGCKASLMLLPFHFMARVIEKIVAVSLFLIFTIPTFLLLILRRIVFGTAIFSQVEVIGRRKEAESIRLFNSSKYYVRNMALLWYVLRNRFALVGVGIRKYDEALIKSDMAYVYNQKPGVFNQWFVHQSFDGKSDIRDDVEWEYVARRSLFVNLLIVFRSVFALFRERQRARSQGFFKLLGFTFLNVSRVKLVEVIDYAIDCGVKRKVTFVNSKRMNRALDEYTGFAQELEQFDYLIPSGGSFELIGQLQRTPLVEHITSVDLLGPLCEMAARKGRCVYLVGGPLGISTKMMAVLGREYPELNIIGENQASIGNMRDVESLIERINEKKPDIVLVSMASHEQEKWINRYSGKINSSVVIGVGDLFEVCTGNIKRVSRLSRKLGFEWFVRMVREKGVASRFLFSSPYFVFRALIAAMKGV